MTSCHLIPTWHEWNVNAGDVMVMLFTSYANLVMSHWVYALSHTSMVHVLEVKWCTQVSEWPGRHAS